MVLGVPGFPKNNNVVLVIGGCISSNVAGIDAGYSWERMVAFFHFLYRLKRKKKGT